MKNVALYDKFLNWLEAEFDLYQTEIAADRFLIKYPLVFCEVEEKKVENSVVAKVSVTGQSQQGCTNFVRIIQEVHDLLKKNFMLPE